MEKIRVSVVVNDLMLGGTQAVLLGIGSRINKEEFDFSVYVLKDYRNTDRTTLDTAFNDAHIPLVHLVRKKRFRRISYVLQLISHLCTSRPDILHCCLPDAVIIGTLAGKIAGVKHIIIHEQNSHRFYSKKLNVLFGIARCFANLTICYSETLQEELFGSRAEKFTESSVWPRKSMVIYNGIDTEKMDAAKARVVFKQKRKELGIMDTDIAILAAARLVPWKGHAFLIRAFSKIATRFPEAKLLIAGEGEQERELKSLVSELHLTSSVLFLGSRKDVAEILAVCDIFSNAIKYPDTVSAISIGMSGMEAMTCGLPTIVSDYPDRHEQLVDKENIVVVKPGDVDSLSDALAYLLEHTEDRVRIGRNARRFVDTYFSLTPTIKKYESVYRTLSGKKL